MSKYLDSTGLSQLWTKIKNTFVAKEVGKGLSANDLTNTLKSGYDTAASQTHTHSNKTELDKIASGDKDKWDAASTAVTGKVDKVEGKGLIDSNVAASMSYDGDVVVSDKLVANYGMQVTGGLQVGNITNMETEVNNKVDKVSGKGLSTEDFTTEEKTKLAAFGAASTYALKTDLTNVYKYKGSVATVSDLPTTGLTSGDVYNVEERGINYAWNGTAWDPLGELFSIESITNQEITDLD